VRGREGGEAPGTDEAKSSQTLTLDLQATHGQASSSITPGYADSPPLRVDMGNESHGLTFIHTQILLLLGLLPKP
jgi:hypothetical protein